MKRIFLIFCVFVLQITVNAQQKFVVDADAVLRTVTEKYDAIKVSGGIDLYLSQSDAIAVAVSAGTDDLKNGIKTIVENGTLHIYYEGEKLRNKNGLKLRAYISFIQLKKIEASGACDIFIFDSLVAADLTLHLSGSCDFKGLVKAGNLDINLSGASDIYISGTAGTVNIESSGASDVHGYELVTDFCNANASGASDINITVNKELNAKAGGASDIFYKGKGVLKQNDNSNSSSIEKKN